MVTIRQAASFTSYPGRGILAGRSADGARAMMFYFIMGRSANSRNRVFERTSDGLRTRARDEKLLTDPSLIIYSPVRVAGEHTIITNGDQTDTVYAALSGARFESALCAARAFERALDTREFEPDAPNYTPRISALITARASELFITMSILKSADGDARECRRFTYTYPDMRAGTGVFLHTYLNGGDPLVSFEGEPTRVALENDIDLSARELWASLDDNNRVSLFARSKELISGRTRSIIINKYGEDAQYGD